MKKTTEPNGWRGGRRLRAWELSDQGWKQNGVLPMPPDRNQEPLGIHQATLIGNRMNTYAMEE